MSSLPPLEDLLNYNHPPDEDVIIQAGPISLNLSKLISDEVFSSEQRMNLARILCWDEVLKEALQRLTGGSIDWCSSDNVQSRDFLLKVMGRARKTQYTQLEKIISDIRDSVFEHRLYWAAYHEEDPRFSGVLAQWLKLRGFSESNYRDVESKDFKAEIKQRIESALEDWFKSSLTEEEAPL